MPTAPPDPPVAPTTAFDPASFPHEPDPAYDTTKTAVSGFPGERSSVWAMCLHCRYPYPVNQNWSCGWRRAGRTRAVS